MSLKKTGKKLLQYGQSGQALVEYALILVLVAILFGVTLAATGPAIGNVFSNTVFNLLGQDPRDVVDLTTGRGDSEAFWATVEWVANNPPIDAAVPTRPVLPPPPSPTAGPSPTASATVPTQTPQPSPTDPPSPTPQDFTHYAPWLDTIDRPEWWRVDNSVWIGGDDWLGEYFIGRQLAGDPVFEFYNGELGIEHRFGMNFDWPSGTSPIEGWVTDDFSIRFTRNIYVEGPDPLQVRFTTAADDGVRLWLNYEAGCGPVNSGGPSTGSGRTFGSGCLIIDNWRDQGVTVQSVIRTLDPGFHVLQLDYYEATGGASLSLAIEGLTNRGVLGDSTIPAGGTPQCAWNRSQDVRSNSIAFMWEEQKDGDFPANTRCYLELRGSVDFSSLTNPKLIFWDVWDLSAATSVWVEIAEYMADPAQRNWQRINLHNGGSANYNWTRHVLDLSAYVSGYSNKQVTFRFGMESTSNSGRRRWYIDDLEVRDFDNSTNFLRVCSGTGSTPEQRKSNCGTYWDLNTLSQKADFIPSGRWDLTTSAGQTGMGWTPNAETSQYVQNWEGNPRIHSLELNGWVDLRTPNIPDADGDDGTPQISFYQSYDLGRGDSLQLQWTRDPHDMVADNWQTVEIVVPASTSKTTEATMKLKEISLTGIPQWNTQPFRLRFALLVDNNAEGAGWNIDNIYLERVGRPKFTDYPFFDDAEGGRKNWLMEGQWDITDSSGLYGSGHSFTDSPSGNYSHGSNASLGLRYPIDFNNDTPENRNEFFDNNPSGGNSQVAPATRPHMTFWFWRDLQSSDNLILEWSKNLGVSWNQIWAYNYNSSTRRQYAWERVVVDLTPLVQDTLGAGTTTDDDVLFRFRLDARTNSSTADGVYIDNIEIRDYSEVSHKLWDPSVNSPIGGIGSGIRYIDDIEGNWFSRWHIGGDWSAVTYDQRQGLNSMHESGQEGVDTRHLTYQVLEMERIIDLRGTTLNDRPTLYFWNHYNLGDGDTVSVEIATENTGYVRAGTETNYERRSGWDVWTSIWSKPARARVETWVREQVSLDTYIGKRIRVRFVFNAYAGSSNRDGWYIDEVRFEHRNPTPINLPFLDSAQSLANWIGEGTWGLAPDQWRGAGGGPAALGPNFWTGTYYRCQAIIGRNCNNIDDFNNVLYENYASGQMRPYQAGRDLQEFALDIFHDFGNTGKPPGAPGGGNDWLDYYAARWIRPITVQAGDYTFITVTDDGVRLKYTCSAPCTAPAGWNIINNWTYHGRTVDIASVSFQEGSYDLILEWFEANGGATIIMAAGKNNFSFTDSPKAGNGEAFPPVNSIQYGNSSLILRRPLRLTGATRPVLEFFTRYRLGGTGRVEVTVNGGFDWTQANLTSGTSGFTCPGGVTCNATISGTHWPSDPGEWQQRQLNLSNYVASGTIGLRFRLETSGSVNDGWYITDVQVNAASIAP